MKICVLIDEILPGGVQKAAIDARATLFIKACERMHKLMIHHSTRETPPWFLSIYFPIKESAGQNHECKVLLNK